MHSSRYLKNKNKLVCAFPWVAQDTLSIDLQTTRMRLQKSFVGQLRFRCFQGEYSLRILGDFRTASQSFRCGVHGSEESTRKHVTTSHLWYKQSSFQAWICTNKALLRSDTPVADSIFCSFTHHWAPASLWYKSTHQVSLLQWSLADDYSFFHNH